MKVSSNCNWVACARNIQHPPFKFLYFPAPSFWGRGWIVTVQEVPEKWVKTAIRVCCFGCDGWPIGKAAELNCDSRGIMALKSQAAEKVTLTFLGWADPPCGLPKDSTQHCVRRCLIPVGECIGIFYQPPIAPLFKNHPQESLLKIPNVIQNFYWR